MKIEVFLSGCCRNSSTLEETVRAVLKQEAIDAEISKTDDMMDAIKRGIMRTPALAIDGKVVCSGRNPKEDEVRIWLTGGKA